MKRKEYRRPQMKVVEIQQHRMLMTSDPAPAGSKSSINGWGDGGSDTEDVVM